MMFASPTAGGCDKKKMATQRKTVLTLGERIRQSIGLGESHFREFKSAYEQRPEGPRRRDPKSIARDIAETLVAFANAEGGEVIAGVEDDLSITGVPHIRELLDIILAAPTTYVHTDTPLPNPRVSQLQIANMPGSRILYFSVQKSTNRIHLTSDGRCLQRRDKENVPVSVEHIQYQRQVKKAMEYDREFVSDAEVSDLDIAMVSEIAERVMAGGHDAGDDVLSVVIP